ncbi:RimK-like ATPgrasp N-terminal domain-containing protein [bacterium]|nr:RimK-like ATPgrasp N-terminal domain-containing protein [bacterium]
MFKLKPELNHLYTNKPETETVYFNMFGNYFYLTEGYYSSLDAQIKDQIVFPTLEDTLDAYVVPLAMEKAAMNDILIPEYKIVNDGIGIKSPVLVYPINPFSEASEIVVSEDEIIEKVKNVTRSGKYAALVQQLPVSDYRIDSVRCVLGKTLVPEYNDLAWKIFKIFKLPLMKIKIIVTVSSYLFSSIEPMEFDSLTLNEKKILEGAGSWRK